MGALAVEQDRPQRRRGRTQFGVELENSLIERDKKQRDAADFVQHWMDTHDVAYELKALEARTHSDDRAKLDPVAAIIRDHLARKPVLVSMSSTTQAAVSKWVQGTVKPTPDKWMALADLLEVPLWELYDLLAQQVPPQSAAMRLILLQAKDADLETERDRADQLEAENAELARELRAERTRSDTIRSVRAELRRAHTEIAKLTAERDTALARIAGLEGEVDRALHVVSSATRAKDALAARIAELELRLDASLVGAAPTNGD